jgi:hypothetical protein
MSTFDIQVSKREIIKMQIEHTRLSFLDRQSSEQNNRKLISLHNNGEDEKHAHGFADLKIHLEYGGIFTKLFMHVSSRNMFPTTRNLQIRVHVFRPRHYCGD